MGAVGNISALPILCSRRATGRNNTHFTFSRPITQEVLQPDDGGTILLLELNTAKWIVFEEACDALH